MIIGPFIAAAVIVGTNETYVDLGIERRIPLWMFLSARSSPSL